MLASVSQLPHMLAAGMSAVFCYNDLIALRALIACRDHRVVQPPGATWAGGGARRLRAGRPVRVDEI